MEVINNYYETATAAIMVETDYTPLDTMTGTIIIAIDTLATVTRITTVIQHRDIILSSATDTTDTGVLYSRIGTWSNGR